MVKLKSDTSYSIERYNNDYKQPGISQEFWDQSEKSSYSVFDTQLNLLALVRTSINCNYMFCGFINIHYCVTIFVDFIVKLIHELL